jgi:capsular exopolysaccharide synthesis family protein
VEEHLVSLLAPTSFESEQYRTLRTLLEARRLDGGPAVIAVSSPAVGDGKTTTAINLAAVLAEGEESRVLLIDADLRNPSIAGKLGLSGSVAGLTHALRARLTSIDELVVRRPPFNIDVLLSGEGSKAPYELLKSSVFADLLKEARRRYEFVIIDTPPIVSLPDTRLIGTLADGFIIVVAAHRTPKRLVEEALNALEPQKVLGLLFNGDEQPLSGYRYHYRYGERYGPRGRGKGGEG